MGLNDSQDDEASVFIFGRRSLAFNYKDRFPNLDFDQKANQISWHYEAAWNMTRKPVFKMGGWLKDYAEEHEKGIELAKKNGVRFLS